MNRWIWVLGVLMLGQTGCVNPQTRAQSSEETERDKDLEVRTIGDVTEVDNVQRIQVSGVGLVTGLDETGHSPPSQFRTMLEQQLRKQKVEDVKGLLDSRSNCLVLVNAFIPAGARKGDVIDIEVTLPAGSKATSLRGGYLQDCILREYENKRTLSPQYAGSNQLLSSQVLAHARGPLLVGFGNTDEMRQGLIWGGGISDIERPFFLWLKADERYASIAKAIADRLNLMFQDDPRSQRVLQQHQRLNLLDDVTQQLNQKQDHGPGHGEIAKAVNKEMINLRVPYAYRYNPERYLRVARLMPLREVPEHQGRYRRRLNKMLLDPADTVRAALRLEALGKESVPALKKGLDSDHPLVRFASAEALAYLGSTAGVDDLAKLAEQQPDVRMYCLMALSSLDEGICRNKLAEMLTMDDSALRCGAFRALRLLDESAPRLRNDLGGEVLGHSFWLHRVAPKSPRLVYFALGKKAEVVLFGEGIQLAPLKVLAGSEFTVAIEEGDDRCTVSRITNHGGLTQKQCSLRLEDVLRTMAELGAGYPEAVDLLRKLDDRQAVNCPIAANTLPTLISVEELADGGRNPSFLKDHPGRGKGAE
ncbi:MAG TPA: flagellar basal body P-ring protein FlgI [Gemmataceae bacterium]|nr:flagellar basal body P-ring protein FlgI [Gemmataceae bacterium]